jgi:drug/metabolite transporter (DMT)-like permease
MIVGLALAFGCALATNAGFLLKRRGALAVDAVNARRPLHSAVALFRSRWWTVGWLVALGAWLLHIGALALAPLSIVQAVLSGGLVLLAVLAERYFGFELRRRQWTGVVVTSIGLAVIGLTSGGPGAGSESLAALISVEAAVFGLGAMLVLGSIRLDMSRRREGMALGLAAGALFGVSDVAIKYLTQAAADGVLALVSPWLLTALCAWVVSFYVSARSLQLGPGLEVIALTSVAANVVAIAGGILVFHDAVGHGPVEVVGRALAFLFVIAGAALMPGPTRAMPAPRQGRDEKPDTQAAERAMVSGAPEPLPTSPSFPSSSAVTRT